MLNLLFISDSPKTEHIKSVLQPELKVIIDVVNDFDHGLKDVFEKRPATVCIQDQIGGVTGESVARHIQMLLGASSPRFILLHSGNGKARAINGLFEHLIDLNQTDDALSGEIRNTLKTLLGDNWEKVYIPPKSVPASVRTSVSVPEESREDADRLVDDFISDLETSGFLVVDEHPPALLTPGTLLDETSVVPQAEAPRDPELVSGAVESDRAQSINDDLAELLVLEADKARRNETSVPDSSAAPVPDSVPVDVPKPAPIVEKLSPPAVPEPAAPSKPSSRKTVKKPVASLSGTEEGKGGAASVTQSHAVQAQVSQVTASVPPAAAEFRINHASSPDEEHIPEDLLLAFEENYRSESPFFRRSVVLVLVCVVCAAGGWFLFTQKPQLLTSLQQRFMPASGTKQAPPVPSPPPAAPAPKPAVAVVEPAAAVPSLPAFVPKEGHDSSYAAKNPGWERYVGKNAEFRLFSASGRIQALQVLAVKGAPFSESYINSVLQEYTGSSEYQRTSSSVKAGVRVESGRIKDKAEVKIYRKDGAVKAFVVSVN